MRILVDIASNNILQVEKTPKVGSSTTINGKYIVDVPEGSSVDVDNNSYVLNGGVVDSGSVVTEAFNNLLARYPMYNNIVFNPLIIAADVADLDLTAVLPGTNVYNTRAQVGRAPIDPQEGLVGNSTAILPINTKVSPNRPGLLITDTIDISAVLPDGANNFMVYWKLYEFDTSADVSSDYGITSGQNSPILKSAIEADQNPAGLEVLLSNDDGTSYQIVNRLSPVSFCNNSTQLRIAFKNEGASKIYLANYAIMF